MRMRGVRRERSRRQVQTLNLVLRRSPHSAVVYKRSYCSLVPEIVINVISGQGLRGGALCATCERCGGGGCHAREPRRRRVRLRVVRGVFALPAVHRAVCASDALLRHRRGRRLLRRRRRRLTTSAGIRRAMIAVAKRQMLSYEIKLIMAKQDGGQNLESGRGEIESGNVVDIVIECGTKIKIKSVTELEIGSSAVTGIDSGTGAEISIGIYLNRERVQNHKRDRDWIQD
ncbi:hypothetical protein EVAR_101968_1 [Eumeta japonica]|uniref:Uncharacterized protein n=1 Tax=Eumeta variegata TaxID=151549 RepID=A0A4C1TSH9_EUMVA|nr:hypothetical protein EVAR_101968_1 [Eumeta japonica]